MKMRSTTSKRLTWVIIIFYILAFFSVEYAYIKYDKDLFQLYSSIIPVAMTVILSYFGKSGVENYKKISLNVSEDTTDQTIIK